MSICELISVLYILEAYIGCVRVSVVVYDDTISYNSLWVHSLYLYP